MNEKQEIDDYTVRRTGNAGLRRNHRFDFDDLLQRFELIANTLKLEDDQMDD